MSPKEYDGIQNLDEKMEKLFDDMLGKKDGLVKIAAPDNYMSNYTYRRYKSAFLTLGDTQIPDDFRQIFKWCRYFFKVDPLVGAAVRSLATFPITDIVYQDTKIKDEASSDDEYTPTYKFYTNMFKELNLYNHLIEIGYDYFLYGNCLIFAEPGMKIVRQRNPETGEVVEVKEVTWKHIERLDVTRIKIERDPKTKEKIYYYDIPAKLKQIIEKKHPKEKYDRIPDIFKKAVQKKGLVKLNSKFIYALSMPSESGDGDLWATPPVMQAMKILLYTNVLRQAQEAIAYEHIVPRRIYYFQETQNFAPEFNYMKIADDFAYELRKQLNDPNYQIISPIPVQQLQHGGQGRALLLVPEIEQLQKSILAAMGVPYEFVFGGMSYSGSTTSLRILENNFITYRTLLYNYVNDFLIKRLAEVRGEWEVPDDDEKLITVEFSELKMQDDIQQKQLMIQLNAQGKIPDEILYEKVFGLDAQQVFDQLRNERMRQLQEQMEMQVAQQQMMMQMQQMGIPMQDPNAQGQDPNAPAQGQPADPNAPAQGQPAQADPNAQAQGQQATQTAPADPNAQAQGGQQADPNAQQQAPAQMSEVDAFKLAQDMQSMSEAERANVIRKLPKPIAQRVMMYYYQIQEQENSAGGESVDMRPNPEQLPPRRQGGV